MSGVVLVSLGAAGTRPGEWHGLCAEVGGRRSARRA